MALQLPVLRALLDYDSIRQAWHEGDGAGVLIAVLDSGVDGTHPALASIVRTQFDVISDFDGTRCVPAEELIDSIGHGTACAGIIARLAPAAEIVSVRVIGSNAQGTHDQLIAGLEFAINEKFDVINMSLGTTNDRAWRRIAELADRAFYDGRILVAAANNFGYAALPAQLSSVLAVDMGAFPDPETVRYRWQNPIELEANGVYVEAPTMGGGTELFTGTSFACPQVTGLVARLVSKFPGLTALEARVMLTILSEAPVQTASG
jgi:subtilisin